MRNIVGMNIKRRREQLRLSQTQLGKRAGYSLDTISRIERGVSSPTLDVLGNIAAELWCTPVELQDPGWSCAPPHPSFADAS